MKYDTIGLKGAMTMHTNTHIITNGLDLGEDRQGKGRYFTSKFLEPGLAKYDEPIGTILLDKETIDKFITSFKGCPVIIDHKEITDDTAKDERVGVVSNVWYNADDGWYYCDGVIFDKNAWDLITNAGYTVSCAYSFNTDNMSGTWHNNPYDGKVVSGDFLHLALVPVPRYEDATIALNGKNNAENDVNLDEPDAREEKDEDMKLNQLWQLFNKKEAINKKGENEMAEKVDKRKLIDEIGGILKGKVDDELIRTIIKKAEEIGYEDSEKSADNKAKNEADEEEKKEEKADNKCAKNEGDEDKKEDKEEKAENEGDKKDEADNEDEDKMEEMKKAENSMGAMKKAYNSLNVQVKSLYVPQSERLALGKQLF